MSFPLAYIFDGFYSSLELFVIARSGRSRRTQVAHCNTFYLSMPRCLLDSSWQRGKLWA